MNHVIDPSYFYDAIEEFAFNYTIYIQSEKDDIDDYGCARYKYSQNVIRGSLQPQASRLNQRMSGNTIQSEYKFYCKSLYRINIGDVIVYRNEYLMCYDSQNYDEWGVREASLRAVTLTKYRDLSDYVNYLNGTKIV